MRSYADQRAAARQALAGKWGLAIAVTFIASAILSGLTFIVNISSMVSQMGAIAAQMLYTGDFTRYYQPYQALQTTMSLFNVGMSLLSLAINIVCAGALNYGLALFNINITRGGQYGMSNLMEGFRRRLGDTIGVNIILTLLYSAWTFLIIIITAIISVVLIGVAVAIDSGILMVFAVVAVVIIVLAAVAGLMIFLNRYALVYYLMCDCEPSGAMAYINQSKELMKGKCVKLFVLNLTFIGWAILAGFAFGLGSLFLNPYINAAHTQFYEDCLRDGIAGGKLTYLRPRWLPAPAPEAYGSYTGNGPSPY